jgi:hypothetical protein
MLPLAVAAFFLAPIAGVVSNKIGPKWVITTGMVLEAIGLYGLWQVITISNPIYYLYPLLAIYGAGVGLDIGQLTNSVLATVPWQKAGIGSGINNTLRQVGSAFGVAVIGAVLVSVLVSVGKADLAASTVIPDNVKTALTQVLSSGLSGGVSSHPVGAGPLGQAIGYVFDDAITNGTKWAALTAAVFVSLGAICSLFIPNTKTSWGGGGGDSASWSQEQQRGQQASGSGQQWGGQQGQQWAGQQQGQQQGSWPGQQQQQGSWGGAEKPKSQDTSPSQEGGDKPGSSSGAGEEEKDQDSSSSQSGQQQQGEWNAQGSWAGKRQGQQQNQQLAGQQGQQGPSTWGLAQKTNPEDDKRKKPKSDSN